MKELLQGLRIGPEGRSREAVRHRGFELRGRKGRLVLVLLAVPAFLGLWGLRSKPIAVDVFTVARTSEAGGAVVTLTAGGYARAATVVYVAPRVPGRLAAVRVEEGDLVREGDVLAVIDSRDLEEEVAEARADYEWAAASLRKLEAGSRPEEIAEATSKVQVVVRATERAEKELARSRALFDAGIISAQAFDLAKTDYLVGQGNLDAVRHSLALVVAGPRTEELEGARAALAAARARLGRATNRLGDATVRAPVAGRVLRKFRNVGDFVSPDIPHLEGYETIAVGSPVVSLAGLGRQEASADVNETDVARVSLHQPVEVSPSSHPEERLRGSVTQISPRADKNKNTVEVKVTLEGAARLLPYDASVKLAFLGPSSPSRAAGLWIPSRALVERDGRRAVFVMAASGASFRVVETGDREGEMVAVTRGLAEGDRVIVSGLDRLNEGTPVRVE